MTNGKNSSSQSPGKLGIFPVLSLFFHLSLPKIWKAHPHKDYIFKLNKDSYYVTKFRALKLKIVDSESIWNWVIFYDISTRTGKKALGGWMVVMVTMQTRFH